MSILSMKKISAAAVAAVLSVSAISKAGPITPSPLAPVSPYATNTLVYSTGFETNGANDSKGQNYNVGGLVGQNSWTYYPEGENSNNATVTAPGLNSSGQAAKLAMGNQGGTSASPIYSDYYNSTITPILPVNQSTNVQWSMNTSLGSTGDFAGIEVFDNSQTIASLFVGNVNNNPSLGQEVEVFDQGNQGLKPADVVHGYSGSSAYMVGAGDGKTGVYQISIDPGNKSFTVSYGGQTYTTVLGASGVVGDQITGIAFATIDQSGTAASATFDDLSVFTSTPEPASIAMIGIGGLLFLAKRPKRTA